MLIEKKTRLKDSKNGVSSKENGIHPRKPIGQLPNGKRLIRNKDPWEDKIGMGQITSDETFKVKETQKIRRDYLKELMLNEVGKNNMKFRAKFLNRHNVSSEVRVRMVSIPSRMWLICRWIG
jgi:hypothetical protein